MLIKTHDRVPWFRIASRLVESLRHRTLVKVVGLLLVPPLLWLVATGFYWNWTRRDKLAQYAQAIPNWVRSTSVVPKSMNINIKFEDYQRLALYRKKALDSKHYLVQHEDSYVPATIQVDGKEVKAKVRLKGGGLDHLEGNKWSLRVKTKGNQTVFGMEFFSIQDPVRSGHVYEWVLHEIMRHEGLVACRYDFIHVKINGKSMGIYALEESFGKELIEAHGRREGPIVKWNEQDRFIPGRPPGARTFHSARVDSFYTGRTLSDPSLRSQYEVARDLLEGFRDGRIPAKAVFDLPQVATYFALLDLCMAPHAHRWKNIRFYYNPVTSLLEPIPYNGYGAKTDLYVGPSRLGRGLAGSRRYRIYDKKEWLDLFFRDPEFYALYVRELARVSERSFLDGFFADIGDELHDKIRKVHRDGPVFHYSNSHMYRAASDIRKAIRPVIPIRVRLDPASAETLPLHLRVANNVPLMAEVVAIVDETTGERFEFPKGNLLEPSTVDVLEDVVVAVPEAAARVIASSEQHHLSVKYRVFGMAEELTAPVRIRAQEPRVNLRGRLANQSAKLGDLSALGFTRQGKTLTIPPGGLTLESTAYIPPDHVLQASPGATIRLENGASLISYSQIEFQGSPERPIVVNCGAGGGGLCVLTAKHESTLAWVRFENLSSPIEGAWSTTGAVSFYESPVRISDCRFVAGDAEDQLNLIRSRATVTRSHFERAASDALDLDFCQASLQECTFSDSQNDAVDASGSQVKISNCKINGAKDKALSAGESSRVDVQNLTIKQSRFGIVSKDLSTVTGAGVSIQSLEAPVAAFQKKSAYGPASVRLIGSNVDVDDPRILLEKGSTLELNNRQTLGTELKVASRVYGEDE